MAAIVTLTDGDGEGLRFLVEDETDPIWTGRTQSKGGTTRGSTESVEVEQSFGAYFDPIRRLANQLAAKIAEVEHKPSEVEVTVGVKLTTGIGVIFAKAETDAEMTVKLVWKGDAGA